MRYIYATIVAAVLIYAVGLVSLTFHDDDTSEVEPQAPVQITSLEDFAVVLEENIPSTEVIRYAPDVVWIQDSEFPGDTFATFSQGHLTLLSYFPDTEVSLDTVNQYNLTGAGPTRMVRDPDGVVFLVGSITVIEPVTPNLLVACTLGFTLDRVRAESMIAQDDD